VSPAVALATAFLLGLVHAIEVDHMIAVTAFISTRPALRAAAGFGLRWGLGHSVAVLAAGGILLVTGLRWPSGYDALGEALVGVLLVAVGVWAMWRARKLHLHPPEEHGDHGHLHAHPGAAATHAHHHHGGGHAGHGITAVGLMHGLAGTSAVVALVPVTLINQWSLGVGYLVAFGLGTILAMTAYALVAAAAFRKASERSLRWGRAIGRFAGVGSIAVGVWWIWRAVLVPSGGSGAVPEPPVVEVAGPAVAVRGELRYGGDSVSFTPCGSVHSPGFADSTDGVLAAVRQGFGGRADSVYAELDGVWLADTFRAIRVRRANAGEGIDCAQPTISSRYVAHGTEPFWAVEVTDSTIIFRSPEQLNGLVFASPEAAPDSVGVIGWRGTRQVGTTSTIALRIRAAPCRDGMSGEYFGWAADVQIGDRKLTGCAAKGFPRGTS
jgi:uncharacterized membrane protein/ABC-type nickel/cobalt efflux system permease component RcnA